ncbi:hypothetical protein GN956_G9399 [Arapaima gigas]
MTHLLCKDPTDFESSPSGSRFSHSRSCPAKDLDHSRCTSPGSFLCGPRVPGIRFPHHPSVVRKIGYGLQGAMLPL